MEGIEEEITKMDFNGVWNTKDTDDFLRYFKWEAFQFGYIFSMVFVLFIILYYETFKFNRMTNYLMLVIIMLVIKRTYMVAIFVR